MKKRYIIVAVFLILMGWSSSSSAEGSRLLWNQKQHLIDELKSNTDPFTAPQTFNSGVTFTGGKLYLRKCKQV